MTNILTFSDASILINWISFNEPQKGGRKEDRNLLKCHLINIFSLGDFHVTDSLPFNSNLARSIVRNGIYLSGTYPKVILFKIGHFISWKTACYHLSRNNTLKINSVTFTGSLWGKLTKQTTINCCRLSNKHSITSDVTSVSSKPTGAMPCTTTAMTYITICTKVTQ